jgi:hypothetical protein
VNVGFKEVKIREMPSRLDARAKQFWVEEPSLLSFRCIPAMRPHRDGVGNPQIPDTILLTFLIPKSILSFHIKRSDGSFRNQVEYWISVRTLNMWPILAGGFVNS